MFLNSYDIVLQANGMYGIVIANEIFCLDGQHYELKNFRQNLTFKGSQICNIVAIYKAREQYAPSQLAMSIYRNFNPVREIERCYDKFLTGNDGNNS
jgi:hypothetical protein